MFAVVSLLESNPRVLKVGYHKQSLLEFTENYLIQFIHDRVGKLNWVNTLSEPDVNKISFPLYPNYYLASKEDQFELHKVNKVTTISSGWVRNYTNEEIKMESQGTVYILPIDVVDLKLVPTVNEIKVNQPCLPKVSSGFDDVLKELKEKLETKKKIHEQNVIHYLDRNDIFVRM
jgi:hypothetical protein